MTNRNYEFVTDDTIVINGVTLTRIRAIKYIPHHRATDGELGGYIEKYENLTENSWVSGNARVSGNACVYGDARVSGNDNVKSTSDYITIGPAKSSGRYITAFVDYKIGVKIVTGDFTGSINEFKSAIESTHQNNEQNLKQYRAFVFLIEASF
jgi:hypothetical protein